MMSALIIFLRELSSELETRANGWAESASTATVGGMSAEFSLRATMLRELSGSIISAMKRTLLA